MNMYRYRRYRRGLANEKTKQITQTMIAQECELEQNMVCSKVKTLIEQGRYSEAQETINEHKKYLQQVKELMKI